MCEHTLVCIHLYTCGAESKAGFVILRMDCFVYRRVKRRENMLFNMKYHGEFEKKSIFF